MPCDYLSLPHEGIRKLAPYVPGKSIEAVTHEFDLKDIIKLASNENPLGCSPYVIEAFSSISPKKIASYPISAQHPLRNKIATKLGVSEDMIALSNGSDMLFPLLLQCFALHNGKHILVQDYGFIVYSIFAKGLGVPVISTPVKSNWDVDVNAIIQSCTSNTALIFLANPNNPSGARVAQREIARLLANIPEHCILVLDEAYYEFVPQEEPQSLSLLKKHSNLIITRTFSKAYGLAGLRVGYAIAHNTIVHLMHRVLASFTVNQAGLLAASIALEDEAFLQATLTNNCQGLQQYQQAMEHMGCEYMPLGGNFITVNCGRDSLTVYQELLKVGIITRPLHPYGLANYLRVSVGLPEQNTRFINAFRSLIFKPKSGS